jgi:hypothetical protein
MSNRTPTGRLAASIQADVQAALDALIEAERVVDYRPVIMTEYARDCYEIAWADPSSIQLGYLMRSNSRFTASHPIEHYRQIVSNRDYLMRLDDGSVIQVAYRVEDEGVSWHRLCWFPCPFAFTEEEFSEVGEGDLLTLLELLSLSEIQMVTPVRFDFDVAFADDIHTHSHLTFNKSYCRIPVFGPLSVAHFFRLIYSSFCSEGYETPIGLRNLMAILHGRTLARPVAQELYFDTPTSRLFS